MPSDNFNNIAYWQKRITDKLKTNVDDWRATIPEMVRHIGKDDKGVNKAFDTIDKGIAELVDAVDVIIRSNNKKRIAHEKAKAKKVSKKVTKKDKS